MSRRARKPRIRGRRAGKSPPNLAFPTSRSPKEPATIASRPIFRHDRRPKRDYAHLFGWHLFPAPLPGQHLFRAPPPRSSAPFNFSGGTSPGRAAVVERSSATFNFSAGTSLARPFRAAIVERRSTFRVAPLPGEPPNRLQTAPWRPRDRPRSQRRSPRGSFSGTVADRRAATFNFSGGTSSWQHTPPLDRRLKSCLDHPRSAGSKKEPSLGTRLDQHQFAL